jgi:hypothetical protein
MINLNKKDSLADAVEQILQQEALKGNQAKIDKNHNNKIDAQDFKILRGEKKEVKKEEVEQIDELSKSTLGSYVKKASDDAMVSRKLGSDFENKAKRVKNDSSKGANTRLADKFNSMARKRRAGVGKAVDRLTKEEVELDEKAPPGFEGTVKAMKKHKDIDNPFALAWSMKNKGYKSHKKADGSAKNEETEVMPKTLKQFKEGWDDMMKAVKERNKPQPNGGSGVKQGSRYGGSKQKDEPEKDTDEKK